MANEEKSLRLRFEVTGNGAVVVKDLSGQVKNLSLNMRQAEVVAKKYGTTVSNLTGKTFKTTGAEYQKMSGQLGDLSRSTGSATSAALELGRVVSDMPYGIRGVANNLSQFASNMLFASTSIDKATGKSIGFLGAIGQLKNALKGPLGLLLLIQGVIAAFDYFSASTFGAKKEVDDLNKSIDEQLTKFQLLTTFLTQKDMKSIDEIMGTSGFQENLKIINNEFGEFKRKYESLTETDKENEDVIRGLLDKFKKLLKVRSDITSDAQKLKELEEESVRPEGEIENLKRRIAFNYSLKASLEAIFKVEKQRRKEETEKKKTEAIDPIFPTFGDVDELMEGYDIAFNLQLEYQRKLNESRSFLSEEQLLIQSETNRKLLEMEIEHNEKMLVFEEEGSVEAIERRNEINSLQIDLRNADLEHELMIIEHKKNAQMEYVNYVQSLGGILSRVAGKNKDLALAGLMLQKGAAIASVIIKNKQANSEIQQQASKDSSEAVTSGKLFVLKGVAMSLAGNPAGVALSAAGKSMIASAPVITAAAQSMKTKNNINAGISIASILATTLSSTGLGGGSGSGGGSTNIGGGGGGRTFDFNLVGSTAQNQLAEGIAGQFGQPIQAYVVSTQMSSQQQLDNIIQSSATLGDDGDD